MNKKKLGMTILAVPVLTAGTVALASAYKSGTDYKPSDTEKELQVNQVVFNGDDSGIGHEKKDNGEEESHLLQKNQDEKDGASTEAEPQADYLFENGQISTESVGITDQENSVPDSAKEDSSEENTPDQVYNITNDPTKADTTLNKQVPAGTSTSGNSGSSSSENQSSGKNTSSSKNNNKKGNTNNTDKNTSGSGNSGNNTSSGNTGNSSGTSSGNGNTVSKPTATPSPKPTATPVPVKPAGSVKDPESSKTQPSISMPGVTYKPFKDGVATRDDTAEDGSNTSVYIQQGVYSSSNDLYESQSVDQRAVFNALDTMVYGKDGTVYLWGADALDKYIRIDGLSFDGGKTWNSSFPVKIPEDLESGQMKIKVSFRLSEKDTKWSTRQVDYIPKKNRIFVLNNQLTQDDQTIPVSWILNEEQHPEAGSNVNLLYLQLRYFESLGIYDDDDDSDETETIAQKIARIPLKELFPGWMEDDDFVNGLYTVKSGRHILEPGDRVSLNPAYTVKLTSQWMSDNYEIGFQYDNLVYLQTLTDFTEKAKTYIWAGRNLYHKLTVPQYIQAVKIDKDAELETDYLEIPDTVIYVDTTGDGLTVNNGYLVDGNNRNYASTKEGILTNKEGTEYLAVPYRMTELTVPETVQKVNLTADNQLKILKLKAEILDEMPEISYQNMSGCKTIVKDDLLYPFIEKNYKMFSPVTGNSVASESNPDLTYMVENDAVINSEGKMTKMLNTGRISLAVPSSVTAIETGAFEEASTVTTINLPETGACVNLEENCFKNSEISTIRCYSGRQYEAVKDQLEISGAPEDVTVELVGISKEGYSYSASEQNDIEVVTLISAPKSVTEFDGTVTAEDGTPINITIVGDNAFENCTSLRWVTLPETVNTIGYQAFLNCSAMEGMLIDTKDDLYIRNMALDGCDALRFIGSNAMNCKIEDGYEPAVQDNRGNNFFYTPTNSTGYDQYCIYFTEASGVYGYSMEDIGGGNKMLYGLAEDGTPWLAVRSGASTTGETNFPSTTLEIFSYAMADVTSDTGSFSIDWSSMPGFTAVDTAAFFGSDLGGKVTLGDNYYIGSYVFANCDKITDVTIPGDDFYIEESIFDSCSSLKTVTFGDFSYICGLYSSLFGGCDNLTDIYFTGDSIPDLVNYGTAGFQFNYNWSAEEEASKVKVHVKPGMEEDYITKWKYSFIGYYFYYGDTPYLAVWNKLQSDIFWDTWEMPTEEEVDIQVKAMVLSAENRIRRLLGGNEVSEPTDYYPYRYENWEVRLVGAPSYIEELDLGMVGWYMDLPWGATVSYVGSGTFNGCNNLKKLIIPDTVQGIYENAFEGCQSSKIVLEFQSEVPPALTRISDEGDFSFGVDDSHLEIHVPEGMEETYIEQWKSVIDENRLRSMMGLEPSADTESFSDGSEDKTEVELNTEESENNQSPEGDSDEIVLDPDTDGDSEEEIIEEEPEKEESAETTETEQGTEENTEETTEEDTAQDSSILEEIEE